MEYLLSFSHSPTQIPRLPSNHKLPPEYMVAYIDYINYEWFLYYDKLSHFLHESC